MSVTVYGASDDLIEVEGDLREEFTLHNDEDGDFIAFSNGLVLRVLYDKDGCWRIRPLVKGYMGTIKPAEGPDSDNYSDRFTFDEPVEWVVQGLWWAKA